jgi:YD repeat-containing protein
MNLKLLVTTIALSFFATLAVAQSPERAAMAREKGKELTVKEWKTTPDGKKKWIDHAEVYNAKGQLIEEAEYSDFGTRLAWRSTYEYNTQGQLIKEIVYDERNRVSKIRTFEYNAHGVCTRRMNYNADGKLNSYRQYEYTFE